MNARHLKALKHLDEVIEALEAVGKQRDRLQRALGKAGVRERVNPLEEVADQAATSDFDRTVRDVMERRRAGVGYPNLPPLISGTANLQTPEREEFEAARKAGKVVPLEMSELQLERKAYLAQVKAERQGLLDQFAGAKSGSAAPDEPEEVVTEGAPLNVSGS